MIKYPKRKKKRTPHLTAKVRKTFHTGSLHVSKYGTSLEVSIISYFNSA